jgi:hypothetical protein
MEVFKMKITVDAYDMKERFVAMDRDYYTFEGLESLLDYYDEIDENMELDVIAICCDCTEYGEGAACSFDDLINEYGYKYPVEEWLEDNALEENEFDNDLYIDSLVERLEDETTVLHVANGNYIVFAF